MILKKNKITNERLVVISSPTADHVEKEKHFTQFLNPFFWGSLEFFSLASFLRALCFKLHGELKNKGEILRWYAKRFVTKRLPVKFDMWSTFTGRNFGQGCRCFSGK